MGYVANIIYLLVFLAVAFQRYVLEDRSIDWLIDWSAWYVLKSIGRLLIDWLIDWSAGCLCSRSVFLAEDIEPSQQNDSTAHNEADSTANKVFNDGIRRPSSGMPISTTTTDDTGLTVAVLTSSAIASTSEVKILPQQDSYSAPSAFHPPLVDDFWSVFLHQHKYLRPVKNVHLEEMSKLPTVPVDGVKVNDHRRLFEARILNSWWKKSRQNSKVSQCMLRSIDWLTN